MSKCYKPLKPVLPIIEKYTLTVSIPVDKPISIIKDKNIIAVRDSFVINRESVPHGDQSQRRIELGVIITVLTYASSCGATLNEMYMLDHELKISLNFTSIESLMEFSSAFTFLS